MYLRLASAVAAALLLATASVHAHDYQAGQLRVDHPTARPSRPGQPSGAAYMTIENKGEHADRLIGAKSKVAKKIEIHSMTMDGNVMKMRQVTDIEIKPGTTVVMQPGDGYHIMLIGLNQPLKPGDKFPISLQFEKAGQLELSVWVEDKTAGNKQPPPAAAGHQH